jgi:NCAIR mutase (PurE)-related protein
LNSTIKNLLESLQQKKITPEDAEKKIAALYSGDLGFANIDLRRSERTSYPEVVYCAGKTVEQAFAIITKMREHNLPVFATKAPKELAEKITALFPEAVYGEQSRALSIGRAEPKLQGLVVVASAGTSDLGIASEAARTAEFFGSNVTMINDIGVAGIHRLFACLGELRKARAIVAVAGMEGALVSVIAGLVSAPVIALPTSVGYGASFGGLSALLGMLSSCAPGVSVVNNDNGFGAGYQANLINRMKSPPV